MQVKYLKHIPIYLTPLYIGYGIGTFLENHENERMARFRDKSALYGREKKPGEPPSWP